MRETAEKAKRRATRTWGAMWNLILDLFWIAAIAVTAGAAIWSAYRYGAASGNCPAALKSAGQFIEQAASRLLVLFR